MTITEFFRYLLAHEPTSQLAVELVEAYGTRLHVEAHRSHTGA